MFLARWFGGLLSSVKCTVLFGCDMNPVTQCILPVVYPEEMDIAVWAWSSWTLVSISTCSTSNPGSTNSLSLIAFSSYPHALVDSQLALATLETWADLFRLRIDSRKTQYWALKSQHRQLLLSFGLPVVECTSDLGATMQYSAKHLNRPFQQRILQPLPFWTKLRKLSLSPWFKLLAIKVALLPRALHASCSVFLGDSWFVKLRTQVMRATRVSRAGANPIFCERPSCLVLMWILVFMMLGTLLGCFFTTTRPTLRSGRYGHVLFKPLVPDEHMGPLQSCWSCTGIWAGAYPLLILCKWGLTFTWTFLGLTWKWQNSCSPITESRWWLHLWRKGKTIMTHVASTSRPLSFTWKASTMRLLSC